MALNTQINFEKKGYGRGLILGLTMAESMLLLVFCLLLIAGAVFVRQQAELTAAQAANNAAAAAVKKLEAERDQLSKALTEAQRQVALLTANQPKSEVSEDWRKLVAEVEKLEQSGMSVDEIARLTPTLKVLKESKLDKAQALEREAMIKAGLEALKKGEHDWPPIINLSEAGGYYFEVGSAKLSPDFEAKLIGDITDQLADYLIKYRVDLIEVVGHTDEQPLAGLSSNLDQHVYSVLTRGEAIEVLKPGDNAGLGLARAIAVTRVLAAQPKLKPATVLPYSAAQLIVPGDSISTGLTGNVESRRRIEIRVRRRTTADSGGGQ